MAEYTYKDSGVAWIGQIPDHWDTIKIKYTSWLKGRIGWQGLTSDEYQDEGAYLITGTDFSEGKINWDTCVHISEERFAEDEDIHIKEGDLLITKDGTIGKVAVAKDCPEEVSLNSGVMLIRNTGDFKYYDQYLYYTLLSDEFWDWYEMSQTGASTIRHLYQEQFYNFEFAYPPIEEQRKIASYLDSKITGINESIKELENTIENYKVWKQAVIHKALTKGLDKNAEMVDSKIEYIGEIPKAWSVMRLKYLISDYKAGPFGSSLITGELLQKGDILVYTPEHIAKKRTDLDGNLYLPNAREDEMSQFMVTEGDIIFPIVGSLGRSMIISSEMPKGIINQRLAKFRISSDLITTDFFMWMFSKSDFFKPYIEVNCRGSIIVNLTKTIVNDMPVVVPDTIEKQKEICNYLEKKCGYIEDLIAEKQSLIQDLLNYKKSLIFEVVTGKRKVV